MEIMGPVEGPKMLLARMPIQDCSSIFSEEIPRATQKRLNDHNSSKGAKFTKGRKWKLAYIKGYNTKSKAMIEEYNLKKNSKLRNLIKRNFRNENINFTTL